MLIYVFAIISIPLYNIIFPNRKLFVGVVTLQLFLILALRDVSMGIDMDAYMPAYYRIGIQSWDTVWSSLHWFNKASYPLGFENGFSLLNWVSAQMELSFHGFLIICAALSIFPVGLFIYRYSKKPYLSFMLYIGLNCYTITFGILRQSIALGILLCAVPYILQKKWIPVFVLTFIAFSFHYVALAWIALYLLYNCRITRVRCLGVVGLSLCSIPFAPMLNRAVVYPMLTLAGREAYIKESLTQYNNLYALILLTIICVIFFINMNVFRDDKNRLSMWGVCMALLVETFALYSSVISRTTQMFYIFIIILIPNLLVSYTLSSDTKALNYHRSSLLKYLGQGMLIILMCLLTYYFLNARLELNPYQFYTGGF